MHKRYIRLECDESVNGLACELVVGTDDGGLSDTREKDEGRFDLSGRETVTGNVDDICDGYNEGDFNSRQWEPYHPRGP